MKSASLEPKPFDLVAEFAKFGQDHQISLSAPQAIREFATHVGERLEEAVSNPALLYGQRTERMFEALLVSLGDYSLLKIEDTGAIYPNGCFVVPDFRVVLLDGSQWLIEVKNVYESEPFKQERCLMKRDYREKLERYASVTGGQLKLAVFWAKWRIWTLVSPQNFINEDGSLTLDMLTATCANELVYLGDRMIGTRPPLRLLLTTDPEKTSPVAPDGMVRFTIADAQIFCGEDKIDDPVEQQIAWLFMQYGDWRAVDPKPILEGNNLTAIDFSWEPKERQNEDLEPIGTLSKMFAYYYAEKTLQEGRVEQLLAPPPPEWFAPLVKPNYKMKTLPLWKFKVCPNSSNS